MSTKTTEIVLLDELVGLLGGSSEATDTWLRRLKVRPSVDWAGRETVAATDAERIVRAYRAAMAEHAQLLSEYDAYTKYRTRRLIEAGDKAYRETAERELKKQYETPPPPSFAEGGVTYTYPLSLWPGGRANARKAALEAHERFQREEPLLDFTEWQKKRGRR